jgi:2-succinyl-5-enolpyruvyl-6-hydroxy-3-cyclohexene-1-carboxylate synthase
LSASPDQAAFAYIGAFVDELARSGVRNVCIAPGSRSTPLALSIASHPDLRTWVLIDERCAGFFALGMARALGAPVALLCTSGTATANFLPAVIEARSSCIPLIVMTADRPPELRDVGAAQTIDQNRLYGGYPKWFVEVALPDVTPTLLRYARTVACRAVATAAASPPGPVHLNFPFREPLVPSAIEPPPDLSEGDALAWKGRANGEPWVAVTDAPGVATTEIVEEIAAQLRNARQPLFICGPQFDRALAKPFAELAHVLGAPLLADPLSQIRWGDHDRDAIIDRYDAALRDDATASKLIPDVVLRIGGLPTSKPLLQYLERHSAAQHIVVDATNWPDPTLLAARVVHADPVTLCTQLVDSLANRSPNSDVNAGWLAEWKDVDARAGAALDAYTGEVGEPFEGAILKQIAALLPQASTLFVSSSMPVRDLDAFASGDERRIRVLANRGANGIDGVVSTSLGVAAARASDDGPLVLVIGDLAFYHDMNGLLAASLHEIDATIVVINNDGGGIFSFLPQSTQPSHFEELFGTPHGMQFEAAAKLYGARYSQAESLESLRAAVVSGMNEKGLDIIEMRTDRARNVLLHREAWARVAGSLKESSSRGEERGG